MEKNTQVMILMRSINKKALKRQYTTSHTPQQNRVAERMNRTLLEITRVMLRIIGLAKSFWAE